MGGPNMFPAFPKQSLETKFKKGLNINEGLKDINQTSTNENLLFWLEFGYG